MLIQVKINRAKKHLSELDGEIASAQGRSQIVIGTRSDPKTNQDSSYSVLLPIAPFNLLSTAGDIVQNLRSALDHLACQLVDAAGGKPSRDTAFPIFKDGELYRKYRGRKVAGMKAEAVAAIDALNPYRGGNEKLWILHRLNNKDKHQLLFTVKQDHLWTDPDSFNGGFWLKAVNPLFDELAGSSGTALQAMLHALTDFVDELVKGFEKHLS